MFLSSQQLDYIDLVLIHELYSTSLQMYEGLKEAYDNVKIKFIGIFNFN